ncbi:hypothetical protein QQ045_013448 [Rhodiola kirilowii]
MKNEANQSAEAGVKLTFHPELLGANEVCFTEEDWAEAAAEWANTHVGLVFGTKPLLGRMKGFIRAKWGDERTVSVSQSKPGIFLFKFVNEAKLNRILDLGPWSFDSKPLVLKPWSPDESFELESVGSLPLWVWFPGLAPHVKLEKLISRLASAIGKPIRTDRFTAGKEKQMYASVLIEVFASLEFKKTVVIRGPRGINFVQKVVYEWTPQRCNYCQSFGHTEQRCKLPRLEMEDEEEMDDRVIIETEAEAECKDFEGEGLVEGAASAPVGNILNVSQNNNRVKKIIANHPNILPSTEENIRGINSPSKKVEVRSLITKFNIGLCAILEAKIKESDKFGVARSCCPADDWEFFCFKPFDNGRSRILLLWNPEWFKVNICSLFMFQRKLKNFKACLKVDMKNYRRDMNHRVETCRKELYDIQRQLRLRPYDMNIQKSDDKKIMEFRKLLRYQHMYNCQKARINWAMEGDLNTAYFHAVVNGRKSRNKIACIQFRDNSSSYDENDIRKEFADYFKNLLNGDFIGLPVDERLFSEGKKVSDRDCIDIVRFCSYNEVARIVKNLVNGKAAGYDGFNSEFYKAAWLVCGRDISESIKTFFGDGKMPSSINSTYLALIPKVKGAMNPRDFRPISCCNVIYKIISTILTNRLRSVLPSLISDSQAAFIHSRNLAHNGSLAQDLLCQYNRVNASKRCMLKIDISKAYDMVDWNFLERIMALYGFPGALSRRSPLPFSLHACHGGLVEKAKQSENEAGFGFHPKCGRINLNHLMFADDLLILSEAFVSSLACIKSALEDFYAWSGLKVNEDKSCIFFGASVNQMDEGILADAINYKVGRLPFIYLGFPLDSRSLKPSKYGIIDKMSGKIKGWSARKLSYAGRLVLIKHVLQSICSYWMRVLIFPSFVMKKSIMLCRTYLWSGSCCGNRNLVAWETVCKPKSNGGLDLKNIVTFNKSLALSQGWDLCLSKESLWIKWMHNYFFKNKPFWELKKKATIAIVT